MYKIFADDVLIYDSTLDDFKIGKGEITKEVGKSGSFVFSVYPDHPFYDRFVALKTVITVYKSGKIVFRGRILDDKVDYWNRKELTCEGELGFLQDSVVRPYDFQGTPAALFAQFIEGHNAQVDSFKRFKVGTVDIQDGNDYINRSATEYSATLAMLESAMTGSDLGGYIYVTHGDDGTDPIPTIHYVKDFAKEATQTIEFGENLKDYVKTTDSAEIATALIPLGTQTDNEGGRLTIKDVNGGKDYISHEAGVALRGWIFKTVVWDDVTLADHLLTKARAYLNSVVNQNVTVELNAIDLHLLDRSIESFNVCEYVHVRSAPHHFEETMLCNRQTMNLLKPENDTVVLGYETASFTGASTQMAASVSTLGKQVSSIKQDGISIKLQVEDLDQDLHSAIEQAVDSIALRVANGEKSSTIELTVDGVAVSSEKVQFTGDVVFASALQDGKTVISGDNIKTGKISAAQIKMGGPVDFYESLDDNSDLAGYIGYITVASSAGFSGSALGFLANSEKATHAAMLAPYGNAIVASYGDAYVNSELGDVVLNAPQNSVQFFGNSMKYNGIEFGSVVSDRKMKEAIDYNASEQLVALFDTLKPVTFKMKDNNQKQHIGFIAQDVAESVDSAGLADALVTEDCRGVLNLNYSEMTAALVAKIQQLESKIQELTKEKEDTSNV